MTEDQSRPRMDLAFALQTLDAYPEHMPPTSQSDRFWFELAARFLLRTFQEREARLTRLVVAAERVVELEGWGRKGWRALPHQSQLLQALREAKVDAPPAARPSAGTLAAIFGAEDDEEEG